MFKNYLKIAVRNLLRHKTYSLVNILGLSIGIACTLLIMLWVFDELNYDSFHKKGKNIYRINSLVKLSGKEMDMAVTSDMMGAALKKDYPQVKDFTRIYTFNSYKHVRHSGNFQKRINAFMVIQHFLGFSPSP